MYACSRDSCAAFSSAAACSTVSACDGRPSRPRGVSTSAETFRRTRSRPSACRSARVRQLCAFCSVGVEWVAAIFASAPPHILHGQVPQRDPANDREHRTQRIRYTSIVLTARPGSPSVSQSATAMSTV
jgi:hypothetical protein